MNSPDLQAEILIQALPYIREFSGKTIVIKYGGNAMIDEELKRAVVRDVLLMRYVGVNPILVHGGGPEVTEAMRRMGKEPEFVDGLRVTDAETMEIVEMVLAGKTNKSIVALLNAEGGQAVGLSGKDGNLLVAVKETERGDLGFVGRITTVNPGVIHTLVAGGFIPVISSVAIGPEGASYNVNADTAAAAIAVALDATKLILMTDVEGCAEKAPNCTTRTDVNIWTCSPVSPCAASVTAILTSPGPSPSRPRRSSTRLICT
jgi:acetylglutamate kinase